MIVLKPDNDIKYMSQAGKIVARMLVKPER